MALSRYWAVDAYTLGELKLEYATADPQGRISLLERVRRAREVSNSFAARPEVPPELAQLAAEDKSPHVRMWIARHVDHDSHGGVLERLLTDSDPFVRAGVLESASFDSSWNLFTKSTELFIQADRLGRLAMVRNPGLARDLVKKIIDPTDKDLPLSLSDRIELFEAYLTNPSFDPSWVEHLRKEGNYQGVEVGEEFHHDIWLAACKWFDVQGDDPEVSLGQIPDLLYRQLDLNDNDLAAAYRAAKNMTFFRRLFLLKCSQNCALTLQLGSEDPDEECRELAQQKIHEFRVRRIQWWWRVARTVIALLLIARGAYSLLARAALTNLDTVVLVAAVPALGYCGINAAILVRIVLRVLMELHSDVKQLKSSLADLHKRGFPS